MLYEDQPMELIRERPGRLDCTLLIFLVGRMAKIPKIPLKAWETIFPNDNLFPAISRFFGEMAGNFQLLCRFLW